MLGRWCTEKTSVNYAEKPKKVQFKMLEGWFLLRLFKKGTGEGQMGGNLYVYFLFFLFRAFHSPSWEAKLPKSSFTFLFLSVSLQHKDKTTLSRFHWRRHSRFSSRTSGWPRWASLWPGSASPSWAPSERPWTPSYTCAAVAPSPSPLWCSRASSRNPAWRGNL